jgi:hypothetical protein
LLIEKKRERKKKKEKRKRKGRSGCVVTKVTPQRKVREETNQTRL